MPRPPGPARVVGPTWLPSRNEWRVVVHRGDGARRSRGFGEQAKADDYAAETRRSLSLLAETKLSDAFTRYEEHLRVNRRNKPRSVADTLYRLGRFFPEPSARVRGLTPARCRDLYKDLATRPRMIRQAGGKLKEGPPLSPDSRLDILSTAKTFLKWCVDQQLLQSNPADAIKDDVTRNHGGIGRSVLRAKELRALYVHADREAKRGDERAVGVLMALLLGMRSGEIVRCQVRDVDDAHWVIEIPVENAKTVASSRLFAVPEVLRPLLTARMKGKAGDKYLLGSGDVAHDRKWVTVTVTAMCTRLRFPRIESAHGLRGAHNDLARKAGSTGDEVVRQLGHESESTTKRSYTSRMGREAISTGQQNRVLAVLAGGKAG
jgi:integrase